jgi:ABC-type phosphate transport system substrate-binding protein
MRTGRLLRLALAVAAFASVCVVVLTSCAAPRDSSAATATDRTIVPASRLALEGAGATFPYPLYQLVQ